jgi:hypothetical protein
LENEDWDGFLIAVSRIFTKQNKQTKTPDATESISKDQYARK